MGFASNLKSALFKLKSDDKRNASNRLTPIERQTIIILLSIIVFPLLISSAMVFLN